MVLTWVFKGVPGRFRPYSINFTLLSRGVFDPIFVEDSAPQNFFEKRNTHAGTNFIAFMFSVGFFPDYFSIVVLVRVWGHILVSHFWGAKSVGFLSVFFRLKNCAYFTRGVAKIAPVRFSRI